MFVHNNDPDGIIAREYHHNYEGEIGYIDVIFVGFVLG